MSSLFAAAAFAACLADLSQRAREAGISAGTAERVLQLEHLDRVIELDRKQPEFTRTFADYLTTRITDERIRRGRALMSEHRRLLEQIARHYGVPPQYLVAFWGLETNFGTYLGKMSIPDALATLACDTRRSAFFSGQLIDALRIVDRGDVPIERMRGSWAGAMGQVQFMPSVYLRHAQDGDGDGRRDLFSSIDDALTSAADFLAGLGWQRGYRWGREVLLPDGFDYALANEPTPRPLREFASRGVTDAHGRALPRLDLPARLIVPAGHRGPKFITYPNFEVIMGWNRSEFYAITVGHLADRIAGAGTLHTPPPADDRRLSIEDVGHLQRRLAALGFDPGEADGLLGPATRRALAAFQAAHGRIPDGYPDPETLTLLDPDARGR